jgi:hypothetical protein
MKLSDVEPGVTYWYCTRNDWDRFVYRSSDQFPALVDDLTRYRHKFSTRRRHYHDDEMVTDPKGRYLKVTVPGNPESPYASQWQDSTEYIDPKYLRGAYDEVLARIEEQKKADTEARQRDTVERANREIKRQELLARLTAAGVTANKVTVDRLWQPPDGYRDVPVVVLAGRHLLDVLARLEQPVDPEQVERQVLTAFAEGELVAHAERDKALGYELRPEQAAALDRNERA